MIKNFVFSLISLAISASAFAATIRVPYTPGAVYSANANSQNTIAFDMGAGPAGSSLIKTFKYVNNTASDISIQGFNFSDNSFLYNADCSLLTPGQSCEISFALNLNKTGANQGIAKISAVKDGVFITDTFELTAQAVDGSEVFQTTPASASFTYSGDTQTFTVKNVQNFSTKIDSITLSNSSWKLLDSNCTGAELGPAATCSFTLKYLVSRATPQTGSVSIRVASIPFSTIPLTGSIVYGAAFYDTSTLTFTKSKTGTKTYKVVTLKNVGDGKLIVAGVNVGSPDKVYSIAKDTCTNSVLTPASSCSVEVSALFSEVGRYSTGALNFSYLNSGTSFGSLAIYGDSLPSQATLKIAPDPVDFGTQAPGDVVSRSITITSNGPDPINISAVSPGPGTKAFGAVKGSCLKELAPNESCTVTVPFTASVDGVYVNDLTVYTNATNATAKLTAAVETATLTATPSAIFFRGDTFDKYSQVVELYNPNNTAVVVGTVTPTDLSMSVSSNNCSGQTVLSKSKCTFTVTSPANPGIAASTVTAVYTSGTATKALPISVSKNITTAFLDFSTFECPAAVVGTAGACSATLTNKSSGAVTISSFTGTSAAFELARLKGKSLPYVLAPSEKVTVDLPFNFTKAGVPSSVITAKNSLKDVVASATVVVADAESAKGTLTPFTCGAVGLNVLTTCSATLSNQSSTKILSIAGISQSNSAFTMTTTCGATLSPLKSCAITLTYTPKAPGVYASEVFVKTTSLLSQRAELVLNQSALLFDVISPAAVSVVPGPTGATLVSTFTNKSKFSVNMYPTTKTVTGVGHSFVSTTCIRALGPLESCTITSKFSYPSAAQNLKGSAILNINGTIFNASLQGSAVPDKISVAPISEVTTDSGFGALSGNVYVVSNQGVSAQTLTSITTSSGLSIDYNVQISGYSPCGVGFVLQPGQACVFMERVTSTAQPLPTGSLIKAVGVVKTKLAGVSTTWSNTYKVMAAELSLINPIPVVPTEEGYDALYRVTNNTSAVLSNVKLNVTSSNSGLSTIVDGTCTTVAPNKYCDILVKLYSPSPLTATLKASLSGAFATKINNKFGNVFGNNIVQSSVSSVVTVGSSNGLFTVGVYPSTPKLQSSVATHSFKNTGTASMRIESLTLTKAQGQDLLTDNCSGKALEPGQSCGFSTSSYISGILQDYPFATAIIKTKVGKEYTASIYPNPAAALEIDVKQTVCDTEYFSKTSQTSSLSINFNESIRCKIMVKNNGGGVLMLAPGAFRLTSLGANPPATLRAGFVPFTAQLQKRATTQTPLLQSYYVVDGNGALDLYAYNSAVNANIRTSSKYTPGRLALSDPRYLELDYTAQLNVDPGRVGNAYSSLLFSKALITDINWMDRHWPLAPSTTAIASNMAGEPAPNKFFAPYYLAMSPALTNPNKSDITTNQWGAYDPTLNSMFLNPGASAYYIVALHRCEDAGVAVTTPTINFEAGATDGANCYRTTGTKKIEFFIRGTESLAKGAPWAVEYPAITNLKPLAKFEIVASVNNPSISMSTSADTSKPIVLSKGNSVTFIYTNNDTRSVKVTTSPVYRPYNTSLASFGVEDGVQLANVANSKDSFTWKAIRANSQGVLVPNPITNAAETVTTNYVTGFVTASTCTPSPYSKELGAGESCYIRQSCMADSLSGKSVTLASTGVVGLKSQDVLALYGESDALNVYTRMYQDDYSSTAGAVDHYVATWGVSGLTQYPYAHYFDRNEFSWMASTLGGKLSWQPAVASSKLLSWDIYARQFGGYAVGITSDTRVADKAPFSPTNSVKYAPKIQLKCAIPKGTGF